MSVYMLRNPNTLRKYQDAELTLKHNITTLVFTNNIKTVIYLFTQYLTCVLYYMFKS